MPSGFSVLFDLVIESVDFKLWKEVSSVRTALVFFGRHVVKTCQRPVTVSIATQLELASW